MRIVIAIAMISALTSSQIERAQQLARSRDQERAAFHRRYLFKPAASDTVTEIAVVTEFRRLVIITEQHLLVGDQMFSRGERQAREALAPKRGLISLKAQLRFHPQNAYTTVPAFKLAVGLVAGGPWSERDTTITGEFGIGQHNRPQTITGAVLEADVPTAGVGQTTLPVGVVLDGKDIARILVDFARLD